MALSTGSSALWSDIQALYTRLNTERTRFSFANVTVPSNPGTMVPANLKDLNDKVNEMSSNSFLTSVAVTNVTVPTSGTLIKADPFTQISDTITKISNVCPFNSFNSGFRSFDAFNSCFSFNSGFRSFNAFFGNNPFCNYSGCGSSGFKSGAMKCDNIMKKEILKYGIQFG